MQFNKLYNGPLYMVDAGALQDKSADALRASGSLGNRAAIAANTAL